MVAGLQAGLKAPSLPGATAWEAWQAQRAASRLFRASRGAFGLGRPSQQAQSQHWGRPGRRCWGGHGRPAAAAAEPASPSKESNQPKPTEGDGAPGGAEQEPEAALILLACGIGLATGASIVVFNDAVHWIRDLIWHHESLLTNVTSLRNVSESELWPKVVFPPVAGGLIVGVLGLALGGYTNPKKAAASSSKPRQQQLKATSQGPLSSDSDDNAAGVGGGPRFDLEQVRRVLRPFGRAVGAAVTLGTGASLGPEGPSVDIGRSVAKGLGSKLKSQEQHLVRLLAAGSGAGVAAGFNAPIAGVFFAVETVLQRQKAAKPGEKEKGPSGLTVGMVLLAAVLAAVVSAAGLGSSPAFRVPEYRLESLYELPMYLVFGALCGGVSASFGYSSRVAQQAFDDIRNQNQWEAALLPCIGGLTTGILALGYPEILYQGFDNVNAILFSGSYAPGLLIQIVVIKIIATSICKGSGLQGGIYAPSIFIGAALGSAFGQMVHLVGDPAGLVLSAPQAYALVGVAAMLASNCQVPLTSVLLLFELTRDYLIIVPTLAAVGISFWVSSLVAPSSASLAAATASLRAQAVAMAAGVPPETVAGRGPGGRGPAVTDDDSMLDGVSTDPSMAKERVAAVMQQLEEVLHLPPLARGSKEGDDAAAAPRGPFSAWPRLPHDEGVAVEGPCLAGVVAAAGEPTPPLLLPAEMEPGDALSLMEGEGRGLAVVVGVNGEVAGVVTLPALRAALRDHEAAHHAQQEVHLREQAQQVGHQAGGAPVNGSSSNGAANGAGKDEKVLLP